MPTFKSADFNMHYLVDDFTDPWTQPETMLLLHGNAESSAAWYAWVPHLACRYRVVWPDRRGFGASTPMPRDFPWTLDIIIDDHVRLTDALGVERFHLVGCKWGGTLGRAFAARRQDRVRTLTVAGTPQAARPGGEVIPALVDEFEKHGLKGWAQRPRRRRKRSSRDYSVSSRASCGLRNYAIVSPQSESTRSAALRTSSLRSSGARFPCGRKS